MRECGLKPELKPLDFLLDKVTPHAGVWIETCKNGLGISNSFVTPHAGVWIETNASGVTITKFVSHSPCGSVD